MKICILTIHSNEYKNLANITLPNKKEYCDKHGYDLIFYENFNHPQIDKTLFIYDTILKYDVVFWLGADTLITNFNFKIEEFINNKPIIIVEDINGINADSIIFKKTDKVLEFIEKWYKMPIIDWEGEQGNFRRLSLESDYSDHIEIVEQKKINAYDYTLYGKTYEGRYNINMCWAENDFILHLPGLNNNIRIEYFNKIINENIINRG